MREMEKSRFILVMSLIIIAYVVIAFGAAAWVQPFRLERYVKPFVLVHIAASLGWLILFFHQSSLALASRMEEHKRNVSIATLLVVVSAISSILITYQWGSAVRFVAESRDAVAFAAFFAAAVLTARKGRFEAHKRLMLIAVLNLIHPAHTRVPNVFDWPFFASVPITLVSWTAIPVAYDLMTRRRLHIVTVIGVVATLVSFAVVVGIALSPLMPRITTFLYGPEAHPFGPDAPPM